MQPTNNTMQPMAKPSQIDVGYFVRALFQNFFLICLCGWIGCLWGFMLSDYIGTKTYTSSAYMVLRYKDNPELLLSDSALSTVSGQFQKTFTSSVMNSNIKELLNDPEMEIELKARIATGTNILIVSATAENPMDAFRVVNTAINNYTQVTDYVINDYYLEEMKSPEVPISGSGGLGHVRTALQGGFLGAGLCAGIILLSNFLKDDIKNEGQIASLLDTECFTTLYFEKKKRKRRKKGILIRDPNISFLYKENVKKLATKLDYTVKKNGQKVILITSVQENEGKSTVAANLALALAAMNKKVLLLDADLRKPGLYKIFEKNLEEQHEIGEYLSGNETAQLALAKEKNSGLYYLFGTKSYYDTDRMLRSDNMERLLKAARDAMDYIIIDTAPLSVNNDAEILCRHVDGAFLVVRQGYARVPMINEALDALRENRTDVIGCIYNAVQTRFLPESQEYGYHYGYYYGYGYGYGYGRKRAAYGYGGYDKKRMKEKGRGDSSETK